MKAFALDEHAYNCSRKYCTNEHFIFQFDFEFYIIIYCSCKENIGHLDLKQRFLNIISKKRRHKREVLRGQDLKDLLKERDINYLLSKKFDEVCYSYSDNAGRNYCFVNRMSFAQYLSKSLGYKERWRKADDKINQLIKDGIIKKTHKGRFDEEIAELLYNNEEPFEDLSDIQKIKLTDLLSKNFIKLNKNDYNSNVLT